MDRTANLGPAHSTANFTGQVRRFLDAHDYPTITARTLRKMVATELDKDGLTGRQIADQLGHAKPSTTMNIYQIRIGTGPTQATSLLNGSNALTN